MSKLDKAKEIIKALCPVVQCGIFDCRGFIPDPMETVYDEDGLQIDVCFYYEYFEVFGLTSKEFAELEEFYEEERKRVKDGKSGLWIRNKVFEDTAILAPRVDVEPVRHGHWISTGFMEVKCSICGAIQHELEDTNYCPNCGAKMDGKENEDG